MTHRFSIMFCLLLLLGGCWDAEEVLATEMKARGRTENVKSVHDDTLPEHAIARLGTLCLRHSSSIFSVAYSPDGKTLASRGYDVGSIHLWDAASGEELWVHRFQEGGGMGHVVFSPDGKQMATVGAEGVLLWDLATKRSKLLSNVPVPIAFSPDSKLAVGVIDREPLMGHPPNYFVLFDLETCSVKLRLTTTPIRGGGRECKVAFSPSGKLVATWERLLSSQTSSIIRLWDVGTGKPAGELSVQQRFVKSLSFSPDGNLLVSAGSNEKVDYPCLLDLTKRKEISAIEHPYACFAVFSPNGKLLATTDNFHVRLWDTATWKEVRSFESSPRLFGLRSLAFSPDGKKLLIAGNSHVVEFWDIETGREVFPSSGHRIAVSSLRFAPDGKTLDSTDLGETVCVWNLDSKKEAHRPELVRKMGSSPFAVMVRNHSLAISPDAKTVAAYTRSKDRNKATYTVRFWDLGTGDPLFNLPTPPTVSGSINFSPDGEILATIYSDGYHGTRFRFWSIGSHKLLREFTPSEQYPSEGLHFSPDGRTFAAMGNKQITAKGSKRESIPEILIWDWSDARLIRKFPSEKHASNLTFSPGGQMLASTGYSGDPHQKEDTIRLWEPAAGTLIRILEVRDSSAAHIAFSPNGRLLATACPTDRSVRIWDVFSGKELAKFTGHRGAVYCVAFSPDGKTVASGSADTTILLWDVSKVQPEQPPAIARNQMPKELARLLEELQVKDGARAYQAIWQLIGAGDDAVAFFSQKLQPVLAPDPKHVQQWLADLDGEDFAKREAAMTHLSKLGELAEPALRQALQNKPSIEARNRIEKLLADLAEHSSRELELHQIRGMHALELIGSPAALEVLKKLANGAPGARLTRDAKLAVQRLERRINKP